MPKEFQNLQGAPELFLRLTKSLYGTGKIFILDSRFCFLKALVAWKSDGVFASALIKMPLLTKIHSWRYNQAMNEELQAWCHMQLYTQLLK